MPKLRYTMSSFDYNRDLDLLCYSPPDMDVHVLARHASSVCLKSDLFGVAGISGFLSLYTIWGATGFWTYASKTSFLDDMTDETGRTKTYLYRIVPKKFVDLIGEKTVDCPLYVMACRGNDLLDEEIWIGPVDPIAFHSETRILPNSFCVRDPEVDDEVDVDEPEDAFNDGDEDWEARRAKTLYESMARANESYPATHVAKKATLCTVRKLEPGTGVRVIHKKEAFARMPELEGQIREDADVVFFAYGENVLKETIEVYPEELFDACFDALPMAAFSSHDVSNLNWTREPRGVIDTDAGKLDLDDLTDSQYEFYLEFVGALNDESHSVDDVLFMLYSEDNPVVYDWDGSGELRPNLQDDVCRKLWVFMRESVHQRTMRERGELEEESRDPVLNSHISVSDAAKYLGISGSAVRQAIYDERLDAEKVGGVWRIPMKAVLAYKVSSRGPDSSVLPVVSCRIGEDVRGNRLAVKHDGVAVPKALQKGKIIDMEIHGAKHVEILSVPAEEGSDARYSKIYLLGGSRVSHEETVGGTLFVRAHAVLIGAETGDKALRLFRNSDDIDY